MFSKNSKVNWITFTQLIDQLGNLLPKCNLTIDSRQVRPGGIFCAYPGTATDGRQFIPAATQAGAGFILWEAGIDFNYSIPNQEVANLIAYVGLIAAEKYANPSSRVKVIGVTGTNGKTSVTHWLNQAYSQVGQKTAIIGTTGAGLYPAVTDYAATTPDPITLQRLLAEFVVASVKVVAMEVSSHAVHQGRVNGTNFATAIFTNLTQDHLDYHLTLENYYQTKRELFYWQGLKQAVINSDDTYGSRLHQEILEDKLPVKIISYGIISGDLRASEIKINLSGMSFVLSYLNNSCLVVVKVVGKFNIYNLLAVAGAMLLDGYTLDQIATVLSHLTPVCGRMDTIILPQKPLILIDYAHTPDALRNALSTLREIEHRGKLWCVFGCGGNRDKSKRAIMGKIATSLADWSIVTSDNPRDELPGAIIKDIVHGISTPNYQVIEDRQMAIQTVINQAQVKDIILIAGKGHETYQEINGIKHYFSDFDIARQVLDDR